MAFVERRLLDDGAIVVDDVRCSIHTPDAGPDERSRWPEMIIPLDGVFIHRIRRGGHDRETVLDATRVTVFRLDEPYRVVHPLGGGDRSLVIGLRDRPGPRVDVRPVGSAVTVLARRLASGLRDGSIDALEGAETVGVLLDHVDGLRPPGEPGPEPPDVRSTRLAIAAEPGLRATLPELGRRVGWSGWELARRFRRATGMTIHRYRTALRVATALERIEAGERDLTALALDLGFADHAHLANTLRREAGAAPSLFRRPATPAELRALRTILQAAVERAA